MASLGISSPDSWPRMRSDVENPFQNAPGPFIYALPNLAGPRLSLPSIAVADCSLDGCPGPAPPSDGRHSYHNVNLAATSLHPPVESAGSESHPWDADLELAFVPQSPSITFDENENDDDSDETQQRGQQQERSCGGSSTPTPSQTSSGTRNGTAGSESSGEKDDDDDDDDDRSEDSPKEKEKRRRRSGKGARRRRRNRQRQRSEQGGCAMGPRVMGLPGIHHLQQLWIQHSLPQSPPALPLPGAMTGVVVAPSYAQASSWYPGPGGGYHGYAVTVNNHSGPTWLAPAAAPVPGLFGLPAS
jgi:hypothetical protein